MDGVICQFDKEKKIFLCIIKHFSDELKQLIRQQLTSICYGIVPCTQTPDIYTYSQTLINFLQRYKDTSENLKMGMLGELLAHILIPLYIPSLNRVSIFFNKEENQIRKGFDIIYFEKTPALWYSEVKSGRKNQNQTLREKHLDLLNHALKSIENRFTDSKNAVWDSALMDAYLTLLNVQEQTQVQRLLTFDNKNRAASKRAILISVLYHTPQEVLSLSELLALSSQLNTQHQLIIFSIQKETFIKIQQFLQEESVINAKS